MRIEFSILLQIGENCETKELLNEVLQNINSTKAILGKQEEVQSNIHEKVAEVLLQQQVILLSFYNKISNSFKIYGASVTFSNEALSIAYIFELISRMSQNLNP
jgi:hypothetical protein